MRRPGRTRAFDRGDKGIAPSGPPGAFKVRTFSPRDWVVGAPIPPPPPTRTSRLNPLKFVPDKPYRTG